MFLMKGDDVLEKVNLSEQEIIPIPLSSFPSVVSFLTDIQLVTLKPSDVTNSLHFSIKNNEAFHVRLIISRGYNESYYKVAYHITFNWHCLGDKK